MSSQFGDDDANVDPKYHADVSGKGYPDNLYSMYKQ